jgi:predicted membrane-bound mannosyltransferase
MATTILLVLIVGAFVGVLYGWIVGRGQVRKLELPAWRRRSAAAGLIAVTAQAALFVAFWTPLFRNDALLTRWVRGELFLFIIAIPCVLAAKGPSRWWLLLSSIVLMIGSFFTAPTP